jgi:hypothetical protein
VLEPPTYRLNRLANPRASWSLPRGSHSKAARPHGYGLLAECRLGANIVWGSRTGSEDLLSLSSPSQCDPGSICPHAVARYAPSVAVAQPSISKSHGRAANKSKTTQQQPVAFRCQRNSVACPKSFALAWRNCPAYVEDSAQAQAEFQTRRIKWGQSG